MSDLRRPVLCNEYLRRAFNIPAVVSEDHVIDVIARYMIEDMPGISDNTFATTFQHAQTYVRAFVMAFKDGDLDLALAGYGAVVRDPPGHDEAWEQLTPEQTALGVIKVDGSKERLDWLGWLWVRLSNYVQDHRFEVG